MIQLEATVENIFASRRLTRRDQKILMNFFSSKALSSREKALVDRIYEALSQGRIKVVD